MTRSIKSSSATLNRTSMRMPVFFGAVVTQRFCWPQSVAVCLLTLVVWLGGARPTPLWAQQDQPTQTPPAAEPATANAGAAAAIQVRRVKVNFFINSIHALDDETGSYVVDFWLDLYWADPALNGKTVDDVNPAMLWNPQVAALNSNNLTTLYTSYADSFEPDTNVYLSQRLVGTFTSAFDLHRFPFDQQQLELQFESNEFDSNRLLFDFLGADQEIIYSEQPYSFPLPLGKYISPEFSLRNWLLTGADVVQQIHVLPYDKSSWAQFRIEIQIERQSRPYVLKIILVFGLLMTLGATVFVINLSELRYRLLAFFMLLMTAVTFDFTRLQVSPHAPYLTLLDLVALLTYCLFGVAIGLVVLIAIQNKRGALVQAERLNLLAVGVYCLLMLLISVGLGWYGLAG